MYKQCSKCKKNKPFTKFHKQKNRNDGLTSQCKACRNSARSEWGKRNNYVNDRDNAIMKKYGMWAHEYDAYIKESKGVCILCKRVGLRMVMDHDHSTGKVRGVICSNCNTALGLIEDNPDTLVSMINYLQEIK